MDDRELYQHLAEIKESIDELREIILIEEDGEEKDEEIERKRIKRKED